VEFVQADIAGFSRHTPFDLVYARFLLTHVSDPASTLKSFYELLRPGGQVAIEDIDFSGHYTYPESRAFVRYKELYCGAVRARGGDPDIGLRLPALVKSRGFEEVEMNIVQPTGMHGEVKLVTPLTMENIADAVIREGLATRDEIDDLVNELYVFAADPDTISGIPRVVQVWARRPTERG
jgi:hypothetical protein